MHFVLLVVLSMVSAAWTRAETVSKSLSSAIVIVHKDFSLKPATLPLWLDINGLELSITRQKEHESNVIVSLFVPSHER